MSLEIDKFPEQSNLATHTVNIFPIVAHKKYWCWIIRWIHPVIDSITTEIWTSFRALLVICCSICRAYNRKKIVEFFGSQSSLEIKIIETSGT